jgi:hypothetical protein
MLRFRARDAVAPIGWGVGDVGREKFVAFFGRAYVGKVLGSVVLFGARPRCPLPGRVHARLCALENVGACRQWRLGEGVVKFCVLTGDA